MDGYEHGVTGNEHIYGYYFIDNAYVCRVDFSPTAAVSDATSTPPTSQRVLSSGTKVGVGIGAALATLAVISLAAYLVVRKRRRRLRLHQQAEPPAKSDSTTALHELQDQSPVFHEMGSKDRLPVEICSKNSVHELEARR
jgi:hypothetical protein